jgi:hypothetical protein
MNDNQHIPDAAEIDAARTPAGAWSRATLASWGVPWPPPKGWRARLLAQPPTPSAYDALQSEWEGGAA